MSAGEMSIAARTAVEHHFGQGSWRIHTPEHGWSDASFVAEGESQRVFIKFGVDCRVLARVAEISLAPALLAAGEVGGRTYAIQEFVRGSHPDHGWLTAHADELLPLLERLHGDDVLRRLLSVPEPTPVRQVHDIPVSYRWVVEGFGDSSALRHAYDTFAARRRDLPVSPLRPTHGDVSRKNFLLAADRIVLIDWDDCALADRFRDLGPLLWWYVPLARWEQALARHGSALTSDVVARIHWWAACVSLDVSAGLLERGYREAARDFLEDFLAAAHGRQNPHAPN